MEIFFDSEINQPIHEINEKESVHIKNVLRLKKGDQIFLTDGKGNLYTAVIIEINGKRVVVEIINVEQEYGKRKYKLKIAIAPTKNIDRFEWFVEKATEIGIDEIIPIICKNSERKIIKTERLSKIAIAAIKQSQKAYLPKINEQINYNKFIKSLPKDGFKFIAHCYSDIDRKLFGQLVKEHTDILVLIGPEGDFSKDEILLAEQNGFTSISLGNNRLRTETAGIVVASMIYSINV